MKSRVAFVGAHLAVAAAVFLSLTALASAQTPAGDQYGTQVEGTSVAESQQTPSVAAEQSALPNTGLSLLGTVVVGGALVGVGVALRRREREQDSGDL
jgi:LPXTG-motif cell wall-anchored protein